jgi:hypothetical protein
MGSSDPLLARFEIRFGSLNFQATGNDYLMRSTNRDELRARRQTGPAPVPVAPAAGEPALPTGAGGAPTGNARRLAKQRARRGNDSRSGGGALGFRTATPLGLHGATTAYVASTSIDTAAHAVCPGRHVPVVRDPSASVADESSYSSAGELPPATSHGYAEWDFSGVPNPVMFRWFLDATDYWFGYSDNSSAGSYDPARECFVVIANDQANAANAAEAGDREVPPGPGTGPRLGAGPSAPPPRRRGGPKSTRNWPKHASSRPSSQRNTARCGCFEPPSLGKPPRAANVRASWASKPASASMSTSMSTTRTHPRGRARSSSPS